MTQSPAALAVEDLRVHYGQREVLRGLNLRVDAGEIYGLLGPNGAGKTTLIRTICGRLPPLAGRITVAGRLPGRAALRQIGLVPQEIALYPHLTARENLAVFGRLSGLGRQQVAAAISWASQAADLASRLDDRIDILSGGWKRRVNIAAAILHRPALLILDEPTVGVDVDARNGLHEVIGQLAQGGMGVLLTTHDLDQADSLCSRVGFLRDGIVAPQGPPRKLIEDTFANRREIIIELRRPATSAQTTLLDRIGFLPSSGGMTWSRVGMDPGGSVAELSEGLEKAGVVAREIRFREPGLDSLFLHLARRPVGALGDTIS
jgi:ABC-2 type transport system ATP-binding protein